MYILHKKLSRGQEVEYAIAPPPPGERTLLQNIDTKTTAVPGVGYNMHVCILFGVKM